MALDDNGGALCRVVTNQELGSVTLSLEINFEHSVVQLNGQVIKLTAMEYKLLTALATRPDEVVSKEELLEALYANKGKLKSDTLRVFMHKLRQKLKAADPRGGRLIKTVGYKKYKLVCPPAKP